MEVGGDAGGPQWEAQVLFGTRITTTKVGLSAGHNDAESIALAPRVDYLS